MIIYGLNRSKNQEELQYPFTGKQNQIKIKFWAFRLFNKDSTFFSSSSGLTKLSARDSHSIK
jgi:hypothetical protein